MATKVDNRGIKVYLDTTDYAKGSQEVAKQTDEMKKRLESLEQAGQGTSEEAKNLRKEVDKLEAQQAAYNKKVKETEKILRNLSGSTYTELLAVKKQLTNQLKVEQRGTEKYSIMLKQYKRVCEEVTLAQREMRVEVGCQGTTFGKAANFLNKYATLIGGSIAAVTGLTMTMRKSVDDYAQMEEAMAGTRKYTGLTAEEVRRLNEDLKKMDTRTAREQLNALAGDAGRLGISSKQGIMEFVDAADKINVALGEDLGEEAVANIGKLAQMFGEDKTKGLRGAMLATGSAINEVAQNSAASDRFLVDFTARVAGVARQAGIAQADIMGFAASMDENMMREETSATAYQNIIMKMYTRTADFAKAAGLDVQEFSRLVRTDANEALLTFAEAMGRKGGLADLAPIFGDLKTEGAGVSAVLSVMAGKADEIRARQQLANQAYTEGTSILKEFDVQNNTVQAGIDKAKKGFHEVSVELGEKLQPIMRHVISGSSALVRVLSGLMNVIASNRGIILSASAALVAYNVVLNKSKIATAAHTLVTAAASKGVKVYQMALLLLSAAKAALTGNLTRATAAMRLFSIATKANPIGAVAAVLTTAVVALVQFATRTNHAKEAVDSFTKQNIDLQRELRKSYNAIISAADGTRQRTELIEEFNNKYGSYLGNLLSEKATLQEIKDAYNQVSLAMQRKIARQVMSEKIDEAERENLEEKAESMQDVQELLATRLTDKQMNYVLPRMAGWVDELIAKGNNAKEVAYSLAHALGKAYKQLDNRSDRSNLRRYLEDYADEALETYQKVSQIKQMMNPFVAEPQQQKKANVIDEVVITPGGNDAAGGTGGSTVDEKAAERSRKAAEQAAKEKKAAAGRADRELAADVKRRRDAELQEEQRNYKLQQRDYKDMLDKKKLTQEQYDILTAAATQQHAENVLGIEEYYAAESERLARQGGERMAQLTIEQKQREQAAVEELDQAKLEAERTYWKNLETIRQMAQSVDTSPQAQEDTLYKMKQQQLEAIYQASMDYARREGKDTAEVTREYHDARERLEQEHRKNLRQIREESMRELVQSMGDPLQQQVMSAYAAIDSLQAKLNDFGKITKENFKDVAAAVGTALTAGFGAMSSLFSTLQQTEMNNLDARYNAEIEAAAGNQEEIERLEKEKAQKKLDIEKKYADAQFAVQIAQIISSTALAIMMAYAQLGPIGGAIAAALMTATGAIQVAAATAQRNAVKNQTLDGGSTSGGSAERVATGRTPQHARGKYDVIGEEDGREYKDVPYIGTAQTGIVERPALISENGAELIVSAPDLSRLRHHVNYPLVIDAINESRRGGSAIPQRAKGNYNSLIPAADGAIPAAHTSRPGGQDPAVMTRLAEVLERIDRDGIAAGVSLTEIERQQQLRDRSRRRGAKK